MMKNILFVALLGYSVVTLSGCAGVSQRENMPAKTPGLLEPSVTLKFSDVPVPVGFKLSPQDSYSFESSGIRVGVLKYQGKANPDQLVNFYKEQMPMYNWVLLNVVEYGERLINLERENETCIISISPKNSKVTIIISIGPKSQISRMSEKTVK